MSLAAFNFAGFFVPMPLPLASGEAFWFFVMTGLLIWGFFSLVAKSVDGPASTRGRAERKRCRHCQSDHPGFAAYCRQCGRRF